MRVSVGSGRSREALVRYFSDAYTADELRRLAAFVADDLARSLPTPPVDLMTLASALVDALDRRAAWTTAVWERMLADRPLRAAEISQLRTRSSFSDPDDPPRPYAPRTSVTLLHLSDLRLDATEQRCDAALAKLCADLDELRASRQLRPELVVVTGGLTARGAGPEFVQAERLLRGLLAHLGLDVARLVIVPGEVDISRAHCQAYFLEREGDGLAPERPYAPKWKHYFALFDRLYEPLRARVSFRPDHPWTMFACEELGVAVAGLNSTIALSHRDEDRHAWVGAAQLDYFRAELVQARERGWLRVAAVHHPPGPDELAALGGELHLLLHGRGPALEAATPNLLVMGTGADTEVVGRYQLLAISARHVARHARVLRAAEGPWTADPRAPGPDAHEVAWTNIDALDPALDAHKAALDDRLRPGAEVLVDPFVEEVRRVCEVRSARADLVIARTAAGWPLPYFELRTCHDEIIECQVVAPAPAELDAVALQRFVDAVVAPRRALSRQEQATLVLRSGRAREPLRPAAQARYVQLKTLPELQNLVDFGPYLERLRGELDEHPLYPPALYVDQRMLLEEPGHAPREVDDALHVVHQRLLERGCGTLLIGDFGVGKSFLMHRLARLLCDSPVVPILVKLGELQKTRSLDELIAQHLARYQVSWAWDSFHYMRRRGLIALLFDGFDELALRVTYDRAVDQLEVLLAAISEQARVVITSRSQHFRSREQVRQKLLERVERHGALRLGELLPFNRAQIRRFFVERLGDAAKADARVARLDVVKDLLGLSANPRMLNFIAGLGDAELEAARRRGGAITSATLYRMLVDHWLDGEIRRSTPRGAPPALTRAQCLTAVRALALRMWDRVEPRLHLDELSAEVEAALGRLDHVELDAAVHQAGSGTLLVRDADGRFAFVHQSVLEWLVADAAAEDLRARGGSPLLERRELSPLMLDFVADLAGMTATAAWVRSALAVAVEASSHLKVNALRLLQRLQVDEGSGAQLANVNLAGLDLSRANLAGADLRGADLRDSRWLAASLRGANLAGADLRDAALDGADLTDVDLTGANCSGASFMRADLSGARVEGCSLRRANLLGARVDASLWTTADTFGAARPDMVPRPALRRTMDMCHAVAWAPQGDLLAVASGDTIAIHDVEDTDPLVLLRGHRGHVLAVAFSPEGATLASTGADGWVRLWAVADGRELARLAGHSGGGRGVAFSPDGLTLASGGFDGAVQLWSVADGQLLASFTGHRGGVTCVTFAPDGLTLAASGRDGMIRLWRVADRELLDTLSSHAGIVWSVAFAPDGQELASGGSDHSVRLWRISGGRLLARLEGPKDRVNSVAYSADGRLLVATGDDRLIRVWRLDSGESIPPFQGHDNKIQCVALSPDSRLLASASLDRTVKIWRTEDGLCLTTLQGDPRWVWSVAYTHDGRSFATRGLDRPLQRWQLGDPPALAPLLPGAHNLASLALSASSADLATATQDGVVQLWRGGAAPMQPLRGHSNTVMSMDFAPDGRVLATASADHSLRLWRVADGEQLACLNVHHNWVWSVAFSPDGRLLASGSEDCTARVWQTEDLALVATYEHDSQVRCVAFSPDGALLATGGADSCVHLRRVADGELVASLTGHRDWLRSLVFSPDGRVLAAACDGPSVRMWRVADGEPLTSLEDAPDKVMSVTFSPDGRTLAAAAGTAVIFWDAATHAHRASLFACGEDGGYLVTPDGRYSSFGAGRAHIRYTVGLVRVGVDALEQALGVSLAVSPDACLAAPPQNSADPSASSQ